MANLEANDLAVLARSASPPDALRCCCGDTDCPLLKHNYSVLDSVERDVHTAARLGQALLARHEALMASAEDERFEMQARIHALETDKLSLEVQNARTIHENRVLLDQLEALNNCVTDSEIHIRDLEANLASSQQLIRKLEAQEVRAAALESQLGVLETEQAELQSTLVMSQAEARSAMSRWRQAERGISDLQEQLERIEREAREERARHSEIVHRMEKEKELNSAAGRLKGAAAAKTMGDGRSGAVVSHFVRDLLSDNANLQLGLAELREMLMNSNDEIQLLREQLMYHQPVGEDARYPATTLRSELAPEDQDPRTPLSPRSPQIPDPAAGLSQELHIHHHYHAAKPAEPKKPAKKKRQHHLTPNHFPPRPYSPSGSAPPWRLEHRSTSPGRVGHSAKGSVSTLPSTRWSVFSDPASEGAPSTVPSSPMSHRRVSQFDRDYDEVTSPTSCHEPTSPPWTRQHRSQKSADAIMRSFAMPRPLCLDDLPEDDAHSDYAPSARNLRTPGSAGKGRPRSRASHRHSNSLGENMLPDGIVPDVVYHGGGRRPSLTPSFDYAAFARSAADSPQPRMHRRASRESVVSLTGGLEIHTLKARPNQLALKPLGGICTAPETRVTPMFARPTIIARGSSLHGKRGSVVLRDNLLMNLPNFKSLTSPTAAAGESQYGASQSERQQTRSRGLGRLVGRLWPLSKDPSTATDNTADASDSCTPSPSEGTNTRSPTPSTTLDSSSSSIHGEPTTTTTAAAAATTAGGGGGAGGGLYINIPRLTTTVPSPPPTSNTTRPKVAVPELVFSPPRTFGINQPGAIPGFSEYWAKHQARGPKAQVVPVAVDTEALREAVEG